MALRYRSRLWRAKYHRLPVCILFAPSDALKTIRTGRRACERFPSDCAPIQAGSLYHIAPSRRGCGFAEHPRDGLEISLQTLESKLVYCPLKA